MITGFSCKKTKTLFETGNPPPVWASFAKVARRKLLLVDSAVALEELRSPPGNRLEALQGDRKGQHSIRINDQYRICFSWINGAPEGVEIVDYH
jgi:proteic killer suppression protein